MTRKRLLEAIDLAVAGRWDDAHGIVQVFEGDATAAWIHAVLHKIEGDRENSQYWYRRAGKAEMLAEEPQAELARIRQEIAR